METSEKVDQLLVALGKLQAEMPAIGHDQVNPAYRSAYTSFESILLTVVERGAPLGLLLVQGHVNADDSGVGIVTRIYHTGSCQWIQNMVRMPLDKHTPQAAGSATTYGKRYGLTALLGIRCGDADDDGEAAEPRGTTSLPPARGNLAAPVQRQTPKRATHTDKGIPKECPVCGSKVYDNRAKKASGEYKETSPDWQCSQRTCLTGKYRTGGWVEDKPDPLDSVPEIAPLDERDEKY